MSLALYAAEFNEDPDNEKIIEKKRQSFKRRIGMTNKMNKKPSRKAAMTLNAIHSNLEDTTDGEKALANFNPIEPPESSGVEKTKDRSSFRNNKESEGFESMFEEGTDDANENEENVYASQYYNQYIPPPHLNFQPQNEENNSVKKNMGDKDLDEKLNYLIELIEQQKGEKTDNITEEILLYGLVGVFEIYVVDSFVTIGKYKR